MMVRFDVLGTLRVQNEDGPIGLGGPRRRDLLALLLVSRGSAVPLGRLADRLWEGDPPATATATLRAHVSHLRRALGDAGIIETVPGAYRLRDDVEVDSDGFEADVGQARALREADDRHGAWQVLGRAVGRWRGDAFAGVGLDVLELASERQRLDGLRLEAQRERATVGLELGHHQELLAELRALVVAHPYDETLAQLLATALYADGRQAEALEVLRRLRSGLGDELGLEPTEATREVEIAILRQELPARPGRPVRLRPAPVPAPLGSTVGREAKISRVCELVADERIVTLVGPGGVGKTRVALESARAVANEFTDGATFVSFAGVGDKDGVIEHVATELGVAAQVGRSTRRGIVEFLRGRDILLVVDGCEHLIEPVGALVEWIAGVNDEVRLLATSRERLGRPGEVVVPVQPLPVGNATEPGAAVELFLDNARRRVPDLTVDRADLEMVVEICRRVDALPLAIELAAARCGTSSLSEVVDLLDDPVGALSRGLRTADPRHRSLGASIRWSYELLDTRQQTLLRAVSVFAGPFERSGADAVCVDLDTGTVKRCLEALAERSLLTVTRSSAGSRYRLLDTIRAFGRRQLRRRGELAAVQSAHLDHHVRFARTGQYRLMIHSRWLQRLEDALPDLRAAFDHAIDTGQAEAALQLARSLAAFMTVRHFNEGAAWIETALRVAERSDVAIDPRITTGALAAHGTYRCLRGDHADGRRVLDRAIDLYSGTETDGRLCTTGLSWALHWSSLHPPDGDPHAGRKQAAHALDLARETGDPVGIFYLTVRLAEAMLVDATQRRGEIAAAERREIHDLASGALQYADQQFGDSFDGWGKSCAQTVQGIIRTLDGHTDEGLSLAETAAHRLHQHDLGLLAAGRLISVGQLSIQAGRHQRARPLIRRGLRCIAQTGFAHPVRSGLTSVAALLINDDPATATSLLGTAQGRPANLHSGYTFIDEHDLHDRAHQTLSATAFTEAHTRGTNMNQDQAVTLALEQLTRA